MPKQTQATIILIRLECPDCGLDSPYAVSIHNDTEIPYPSRVECKKCRASMLVMTTVSASIEFYITAKQRTVELDALHDEWGRQQRQEAHDALKD